MKFIRIGLYKEIPYPAPVDYRIHGCQNSDIKIYSNSKLKYAIYEGNIVYFLNTDYNQELEVVIAWGGQEERHVLQSGELKRVELGIIRGIVENSEIYREELRGLLGWPLNAETTAESPEAKLTKLSEEDGFTIYRMEIVVFQSVSVCGLF